MNFNLVDVGHSRERQQLPEAPWQLSKACWQSIMLLMHSSFILPASGFIIYIGICTEFREQHPSCPECIHVESTVNEHSDLLAGMKMFAQLVVNNVIIQQNVTTFHITILREAQGVRLIGFAEIAQDPDEGPLLEKRNNCSNYHLQK
ncbi:hypothetical protein FB45DRAFT_876023 [Roridomyces roridus]|uniref:Uncharacterized protein n=1 Tax=Roridomyces roridus TaxID=1738132 RepID=A0AAD7F9C0_9AGAR|nr:hypothetical protein FB45DRAFT_876023 [Roridomyces roridus]